MPAVVLHAGTQTWNSHIYQYTVGYSSLYAHFMACGFRNFSLYRKHIKSRNDASH